MYIGTQYPARHDTDLEVLAQLGVEHVCMTPPEPWTEWTIELLTRWREKHARFGLSCDMMHLPLGSGTPQRDREIDQICDVIRMAAAAGFRGLNYNITLLGHLRTSPRKGRGGAILSSFEYDKLDQSLPEFEGVAADADTRWEWIDHWLERVVPVAEESKVQLACHPQDPGLGERTYRGEARVMGTVEGLKKFVHMHESPYHGLNFCQGTISELLEKPGEEIFDIIRYFGSRKKIFNVHFRNIKGGFLNFVEVFPDEGEVDMLKAMRTYREVGYEYMIMPDHVPTISGAEATQVGFAYAYGYIHAMLQTVNTEVGI